MTAGHCRWNLAYYGTQMLENCARKIVPEKIMQQVGRRLSGTECLGAEKTWKVRHQCVCVQVHTVNCNNVTKSQLQRRVSGCWKLLNIIATSLIYLRKCVTRVPGAEKGAGKFKTGGAG